jgi:hypothetical protein
MFPGRYNAAIANKMVHAVMRSAGRIRPQSRCFICPRATKLRTTITTHKIASVIKVNFNITRNDIVFFSCAILYPFKIHCGPGLP